VVERLLCISGEDAVTIDRKFLGSVTMKLPTRFVFLTNELPRLTDASYDTEDVTLTEKLLTELPGILKWAIDGWKRLTARGRFVQSESAEDAIRELEDLASPVGAFVRERCSVGPGHRALVDDLYQEWQAWCARDDRAGAGHAVQGGAGDGFAGGRTPQPDPRQLPAQR
jgi:putative DNA primase/helicase